MTDERTQIVIRMVIADYRSALREIRDSIGWLRDQISDAERNRDGAFTPGNMGATVTRLEAARWKAKALRETLMALGAEQQVKAATEDFE